MNAIYNFYHAHSQIMKGDFEKFMELAKELTPVISYKDNPIIKNEVEEFLKCYYPRVKECFTNAFFLSFNNKDFDYVLGVYSHFIPLEHAWNYHKPTGLYVDLTAELLLDSDHIYSAQYQIPASDLREITFDLNENIPPSAYDLIRLDRASTYML